MLPAKVSICCTLLQSVLMRHLDGMFISGSDSLMDGGIMSAYGMSTLAPVLHSGLSESMPPWLRPLVQYQPCIQITGRLAPGLRPL
jgi:hypothetical protein